MNEYMLGWVVGAMICDCEAMLREGETEWRTGSEGPTPSRPQFFPKEKALQVASEIKGGYVRGLRYLTHQTLPYLPVWRDRYGEKIHCGHL